MIGKYLRYFLVLPFLCILIVFVSSTVSAAEVVINEVFANPENEDDEFIELFNTTDTSISISDWKISDKVKTFVISDTLLSPKGYVSLKKSKTGSSAESTQ